MRDEAFAWMQRIKAVERGYGVIRFGTDMLLAAVTGNPRVLLGQVQVPHSQTERYRNVLVHERTEAIAVVSMREATKALCIFLSRLQAVW